MFISGDRRSAREVVLIGASARAQPKLRENSNIAPETVVTALLGKIQGVRSDFGQKANIKSICGHLISRFPALYPSYNGAEPGRFTAWAPIPSQPFVVPIGQYYFR
jgi:hypothetical protein